MCWIHVFNAGYSEHSDCVLSHWLLLWFLNNNKPKERFIRSNFFTIFLYTCCQKIMPKLWTIIVYDSYVDNRRQGCENSKLTMAASASWYRLSGAHTIWCLNSWKHRLWRQQSRSDDDRNRRRCYQSKCSWLHLITPWRMYWTPVVTKSLCW